MVHPVQRHRRRRRASRRLRDAAGNFGVKGWLWWRQVDRCPASSRTISPARSPPPAAPGTPASSPKIVQWGDTKLEAHGLGAYIAQATADGDFRASCSASRVMCALVVVFNRLLWRPLYDCAEARFGFD